MGFIQSIGNGIGGLINGFKTLLNNIFSSFKESLYGIKIQKTQTNRYDLVCEVLDTNHNIEPVKGKLTPNGIMAFMPSIESFIYQPIVWNRQGRRTVLISRKQHDNKGLQNAIELSNGLKTKLTIKSKVTPKTAKEIILTRDETSQIFKDWLYDDIWATINVEFMGGSIDPTLFDNEYSIPFGSQSTLIINSDIMGFLKRSTDMTIITTLIIGILLGVVIGGLM